MSIKAYVEELEQIQTEIKYNNNRNKLLRVRGKELELNISDYINTKGQHGLKYKGQAILLENRDKRTIKNKKDKEASVISLLEELGISDPEGTYNRIIDVQRNDPIPEMKLKFTKLKKREI